MANREAQSGSRLQIAHPHPAASALRHIVSKLEPGICEEKNPKTQCHPDKPVDEQKAAERDEMRIAFEGRPITRHLGERTNPERISQ